MSARALALFRATPPLTLVSRLALAVLIAALGYRFALFAVTGFDAVLYPYELDYGEGIVWQQMRWIFTAKAYGPIDGFPTIVFHYTPLYHAVTSLISANAGLDELATGRAVSLVATLLAAFAAALIVSALLQAKTGRPQQQLCAAGAALVPFLTLPVIFWAPLMRVDMLALALTLSGLAAALHALDRPKLIHVAASCFVAALYTKQTSIAAPAATFAVLLALRPALALRGLATSAGLGVAALFILGWLTDGGFLRHIFLYNVNRFEPSRLAWIGNAAAVHAPYVGIALLALARQWRELRARHGGRSLAVLRDGGSSQADIRMLIAMAYVAATTIMLLMVGKSGSSINYFLEWFFALGLFVALGLLNCAEAATGRAAIRSSVALGIPIALAVQAMMTPTAPYPFKDGARNERLAQLSVEIAAAREPVISDDMVLLLRSGREVVWEPAIFAELASTGIWDERPFAARIRAGDFAFFITFLERGADRFDERYNPLVADAIDAAYPVKEKLGALTIHRRAKAQP